MNKKEMLNQIRLADTAYYRDSTAIMTDAEYDKLRSDFISLYGEDELGMPDVIDVSRETFIHPQKALSLDKVKADEPEKLKDWLEKIADEANTVVLMKKYDGARIIIYGDKVVGRGSGGIEGEVYKNFISKYPLDMNKSKYPVSGEVLLTKKDFEEINADLISKGLPVFKNIRNAASGILRSKERSPYLDKLTFVAYDLMSCKMSLTDKLDYLQENTPFDVTGYLVATKYEVPEMISTLFEQYQREDFPVDGVVVKSNLEDSINRFGETNHHYLDGFAWKPFMDGEKTILRNIRWQVGRSKVTAVAEFDPVEIDGTTVTNASVSNIGIIKKLGLSIGATILVTKANFIIPQIVMTLSDGDTPIIPPEVCPICGEPLVVKNDVLYCENEDCAERFIQDLDYLGSKKILDIKGLSETTIRKMSLHSIYDIFDMKKEDFLNLPGFAAKSAEKLYEAIQSARQNVSLPKFIAACCVSGIGITVGEALAQKYSSYEELKNALLSDEDFSSIEGIGSVNNELLHGAKFINNFIALREYINPVIQAKVASSGATFVITGKLSKPRSYFEEYIKAHGGKIAGSVSKNTDFLLCESKDSMSTKAKKARELNIKVIGEDELDSALS